MNRGVDFHTVISGIHAALEQARTGIAGLFKTDSLFPSRSSSRICQADAGNDPGLSRLGMCGGARFFREGHPRAFQDVFDRARSEGLLTVAHAGEGHRNIFGKPSSYSKSSASTTESVVWRMNPWSGIWFLPNSSYSLSLSNVKLKVFPSLDHHNVKRLLQRGLCVSIHSDDPAYFGGFVRTIILPLSARSISSPPTSFNWRRMA